MYSDGLTEAMNQEGELYGLGRLEEQLLRMRATGSARAACEAVYRDVAAFECRPRRARCRPDASVAHEADLGVGADVHHQRRARQRP